MEERRRKLQNKKESNIFEKIVKKNYKNELETVLEGKYFGENAKSLLLEILYKIETAYKDYEKVKKDVKPKEKYIEDFIKTVNRECKTIKIVKPNSQQSIILGNRTFTVNKEKGEIVCFPIARKLLYSISKIDKNDKIVSEKYFLLRKTMSNLINVGDSINTVEPLRDFNGWSWTTVPREYESIEYNFIYQILLMMVGHKFCNNWVKNGNSIIDYMEELQNKLEVEYNAKIAEDIIKVLSKLSVLMELRVNPEIKIEIKNSKENVAKQLEKFDNKQEYIKELTIKKNELVDKIKKIDTIINDKDLLQNEYVKRNKNLPPEEKIFSMRILREMMVEEREDLFEELEELNALLKPKEFIERKEALEKEYQILNLANVKDETGTYEETIKIFQEQLLECFKLKIKRAQTKQDIINLIYQFRYYCLLPVNENEYVFMQEPLKNKLNEVGKMLIKKAVEEKVIIEFSRNQELNYEIIKNLFTIRVIILEDSQMKITNEKDEYFVQFFDENTFDKKIKLNVGTINKKELSIRPNKRIKIFE